MAFCDNPSEVLKLSFSRVCHESYIAPGIIRGKPLRKLSSCCTYHRMRALGNRALALVAVTLASAVFWSGLIIELVDLIRRLLG